MSHLVATRRWSLWLLALYAVGLAACSQEHETPTHLRIAVLPDQSAELLHRQHASLVEHLGQTLGVTSELIVPQGYADLLAMFRKREVDLVFFGGLTFLKARRFDGAVPVATRDIDLRFTTTLLARQSASGKTIEEFRGERFSFGSKQSTSGHLMPRYYLQERGIVPETFFSEVRNSRAHDMTVNWVDSGVVDLGAVNTYILQSMFDEGLVEPTDFRIVWVTPPYPNYVWAVRPELSAAFRQRLQQAFLALTPQNPEHNAILASQSGGGFLPVHHNDFHKLETIAENLGLLTGP
jgi:phosphonate transport system substrate-binding protein